MVNGAYRLPIDYHESIEGAGERRVAMQAIKILKMAIRRASGNGFEQGDEGYQQAVCDEVASLNERYGEGWTIEDDGWCYKDFSQNHQVSDVLIFLRELGVKWEQLDKTQIATAMHLRMSAEDFGIISNPATHDVNVASNRRVV